MDLVVADGDHGRMIKNLEPLPPPPWAPRWGIRHMYMNTQNSKKGSGTIAFNDERDPRRPPVVSLSALTRCEQDFAKAIGVRRTIIVSFTLVWCDVDPNDYPD